MLVLKMLELCTHGFDEHAQRFARFEQVELIHWIMNAVSDGTLGIHAIDAVGTRGAVVLSRGAIVPSRVFF